MSEAKIGIVLRNGQIGVSIQIKDVSQAELAILATNLEIIKQRLISNYKKSMKPLGGDKNGK